jgi:hypothetical protein
MVVERIDILSSRSQWIFVTGTLTGEPISIGDTLSIQYVDGPIAATIRTIEMHSLTGETTIALDAELKPIMTPGTVIERLATP